MKKLRTVKKVIATLRNEGIMAFFKTSHGHIKMGSNPYRPDEASIVFEALKADTFKGLMVDVGAHFGGALSSFVRCGWHVFAFEPDSENRNKLEKSFGGMHNVVIDGRAVSDRAQEKATLYKSKESTGISGLSAFHSSHKPGEEVNVITLGYFFDEQGISNKDVDFLKIDTEGLDLRVLEGIPWQRISPRMILCEFEDSKTVSLGYSFHDLANFLIKHGYRLIVSEWHPIERYGVPHDWRRFATYPCELYDPRAWGNIIATNEDKLYASLLQICNVKL